MLCSAPPSKSGSNWLDRLRSNKGIPTGEDIDLDSFLTTTAAAAASAAHSHSVNSTSDNNLKNPTTRVQNRTRASETEDPPMSSVLAELFNMGNSLSQSTKKYPRKQKNPKSFVASSSSNSSIDHVPTANSLHKSDVMEAEEEAVDGGDEEQKDNDNENENEKDGHELKGFSRSEVTVIDTSCPGWKVDKLVFRKNNVWKVRERKPKSKFFPKKKKKKGSLLAHGFGINSGAGSGAGVGGEDKAMALEHQFGIGTLAETNEEQFITTSRQVRANNILNMRGEKPVKTHKMI